MPETHLAPSECMLAHTFGLTRPKMGGIKMKLVKIIAILVETVALVFVLAGCPSSQCSTSPDGTTVTCNGNGDSPDDHSIVHNDPEQGIKP